MAGMNSQLNWLLEDLIGRVPGAHRVVALSADGLPLAAGGGLSTEDTEHLSAIASAFQSLSVGTARHFDTGTVRQTVVEMDRAFLLVTTAGRGACLALLAGEEADLGMVAFELNLLVTKVGQVLSAAPRSSTAAPAFR